MYLLSHTEFDGYLNLVYGLDDFDFERLVKEKVNGKLKGLTASIWHIRRNTKQGIDQEEVLDGARMRKLKIIAG